MPAWSFYSNFYDTFLEENQNTFGISIYAWNVLKVYNLGIFLVGGICLDWRERIILQKFLCNIIKHFYIINFNYVDLTILVYCILCKNNSSFSLKQELSTLTLLIFWAE